jgi:hypothetical protein
VDDDVADVGRSQGFQGILWAAAESSSFHGSSCRSGLHRVIVGGCPDVTGCPTDFMSPAR